MTQQCSLCKRKIPDPTDALTSRNFTLFQQDKLCESCREHPERQEFFNSQTPEAIKAKAEAEAAQEKKYYENIDFIEKQLGPIDWSYEGCIDNENPFKACQLRDTLLTRREYNIITDQTSQVIYLWTEKTGVYHKHGEEYLKTLLDRVLGAESTTRRINETIELLKIRTYATIKPSKLIAVTNGLLDITTGKIEPFTKIEFNTNKLQVEYKEGAVSEAWIKFVNQICPDDKELLQEWSGYLLIKGYPYHALMWLYGPKGRNGKGVWARTMQAILGEENYSAVPIDEFDGKHRFAIFSLHDSLFNICSEPRTDRKLTIEQLQALSGQDPLDAERKGIQDRFKFKNPAKMTVMGNKFPNVDNPTDAFWDRLKLIKFPYRFVGTDQIPDLENTWLNDPEQRSGVLNWMIEGALRLIKNNGRFTETKTQQEVIIQFKRASDNIGAFLAEAAEISLKETTQKTNAYDHYKDYCDNIGVQPESLNQFNERLENTPGIKATSTRIGVGKDRQKVKIWKGLKLKDLPEEPEPEEPEDTQQKLTETGTTGTTGTTFDTSIPRDFSENQKINKDIALKLVPTVPTVPHSDIMNYQGALTCVFCNKPILDDNWTRDDFTWDKHAHLNCYNEKREQLANQEDKEAV